MAGISHKEVKLIGEEQDPTLEWENLAGLENEKFGKLIRALGKTAADYRESISSEYYPRFSSALDSEESLEARKAKLEEFPRIINNVDGFIGTLITGTIQYSSIDPNTPTQISKSAVFKDGDPVLFMEFCGTEDLDEPSRDPIEIQTFVGLNDYLRTDAGKRLANNVLSGVLQGYKIFSSNVPTDMQTLGTVPAEVFVPFASEA